MDENVVLTTVNLPPFCIDSIKCAEWLQKLANLDAKNKRITAQAAAMVAQLDTDSGNLTRRFGHQLLLPFPFFRTNRCGE